MDLKYARARDYYGEKKWDCYAELQPDLIFNPASQSFRQTFETVSQDCAEPSPENSGQSQYVECFSGNSEGDICRGDRFSGDYKVDADLRAFAAKPCPG